MDNPQNMQEIFKIAQNIASNMDIPKDENGNVDPNKIDMNQIFSQVSSSMSNIMTPEFVSQFEEKPKPSLKVKQSKKSKIAFADSDEEIDLEEESDELPKTKDLYFTLNVSLKHLYFGKTKNVAVKRKRFNEDKTKLNEDRKVLAVEIKPGMQDEEIIVFKGEGDEKENHIPGDVVITLYCEEHTFFSRLNNDIFINKDISLSECYSLDYTFKHLNGETIGIKRKGNNIVNNGNLFKIKNLGMPILNEDSYGDLYIKFNYVIPETIEDENIELLQKLFPPILEKEKTDNYVNFEQITDEELDSFLYEDSEESEYEEETE
jgi:DnaJ-class molecular chaperone